MSRLSIAVITALAALSFSAAAEARPEFNRYWNVKKAKPTSVPELSLGGASASALLIGRRRNNVA
jgi:hypothetical protein